MKNIKTNNSVTIEHIKKEIKNLSSNVNNKILLLFDLDSTLFNTAFRSYAIFLSFAKDYADHKLCSTLCKKINHLNNNKIINQKNGFLNEVYDPFEYIKKHYHINIDKKSKLADLLRRYWSKKFFHGSWLKHDKLYPGAYEFIDSFKEKNITISYLSARNRKNLYLASIKSLADHKLPTPDIDDIKNDFARQSFNKNPPIWATRTVLYLKKQFDMDDCYFKQYQLAKLINYYDQIFYFENEPEIVAMTIDNFKQVKTYLFNSVHSKKYTGPDIFAKAKNFSSWQNESNYT